MRAYNIKKPTHEFLDRDGNRVGVLQLRGSSVMINMNDGERKWAVESCCRHVTGYGDGVSLDGADSGRARDFLGALNFLFHTRAIDHHRIHSCRPVGS